MCRDTAGSGRYSRQVWLLLQTWGLHFHNDIYIYIYININVYMFMYIYIHKRIYIYIYYCNILVIIADTKKDESKDIQNKWAMTSRLTSTRCLRMKNQNVASIHLRLQTKVTVLQNGLGYTERLEQDVFFLYTEEMAIQRQQDEQR